MRQTGVGRPAGLQTAIGGEFEPFGIVERELLRYYGLQPDHHVVDVGCGSGRLAIPLSAYLTGSYVGTDVVPDLVHAARTGAGRADWRFETVDRLHIPDDDDTADFVCFFSVLTHLLPEQSYIYLEDARRVLKPGGRIVVSFLEFAMEFHWTTFQETIENERAGGRHPLNMFVERGALSAWAKHLGLAVVDFRDGDQAFVPLPHPIELDDGRVMAEFGNLGQSICVLGKPG